MPTSMDQEKYDKMNARIRDAVEMMAVAMGELSEAWILAEPGDSWRDGIREAYGNLKRAAALVGLEL